jgi:transcriptional regulator with XRE-family HTH domain
MQTLREWRKLRGLSQRELAEKAGVSRNTIGSIETGAGTVNEPYSRTLYKLATALGISVQQLHASPTDWQPDTSESSAKCDVEWDSEDGHHTLRPVGFRRKRSDRPGAGEPSEVSRKHLAKVLSRGLRIEQLEAVLFLTLVEHLVRQLERELWGRPHEYVEYARGLRASLQQVIDDAKWVARVIYLAELWTEGFTGLLWKRDTDEGELREITRAIERWEFTYGLALDDWLGEGPWWDSNFDRDLHADRSCFHSYRHATRHLRRTKAGEVSDDDG